jgi:hypothetical protein
MRFGVVIQPFAELKAAIVVGRALALDVGMTYLVALRDLFGTPAWHVAQFAQHAALIDRLSSGMTRAAATRTRARFASSAATRDGTFGAGTGCDLKSAESQKSYGQMQFHGLILLAREGEFKGVDESRHGSVDDIGGRAHCAP